MITSTSILVGCNNKVVWIRVEGKGSFLNSGSLKEFAREMIDRGHREFMVDLAKCPVMDSTFMGTLTGVALQLREHENGRLCIINLNERNKDLLCNLGLNQLFVMEDGVPNGGETAAQLPLQSKPGSNPTQQAQTMLEAHEALV
ncbi:MAG: STAS domain-containing protein, partial [Verrucomicrobiota bacterium]